MGDTVKFMSKITTTVQLDKEYIDWVNKNMPRKMGKILEKAIQEMMRNDKDRLIQDIEKTKKELARLEDKLENFQEFNGVEVCIPEDPENGNSGSKDLKAMIDSALSSPRTSAQLTAWVNGNKDRIDALGLTVSQFEDILNAEISRRMKEFNKVDIEKEAVNFLDAYGKDWETKVKWRRTGFDDTEVLSIKAKIEELIKGGYLEEE